MTKETFEIGETEKHLIIVDASLFWKRITIEIDGKTMVNEYHYSSVPKEFKFDVGTRARRGLLTHQSRFRWQRGSKKPEHAPQ
jgi:hypothetical protein